MDYVSLQMGDNMEKRKMTVNYRKLWKLLIDRQMKKPELKERAQISPGTYAKLNSNQFVSMDVLARICGVLNCDIGDIVEMVQEEAIENNQKEEKI